MDKNDVKEIVKDMIASMIMILMWGVIFSALAFGIAKSMGKV